MTPARIYDVVFASKDYAGEAARLHELIQARSPGAAGLLDVACGTGRHLEHLAEWYAVEGLDLDPAMLEQARARLGATPLHSADMRDFALGRQFDVVTCLFSSIAHVETRDDLDRAIGAMARHLRPGGVLIVEPWISPDEHPPAGEPWVEVFEQAGVRVALMEASTLEDGVWVEDAHYLVWSSAGIEHLHERERNGAFTREDHLEAFVHAGLDADHDPVGLIGRGLFVGKRRD